MVALCNRADHYIFALWFLSFFFFFFLAESQQSKIGCLPYFHTWCGLKCEFKMQVWNVLHAARWKIQDAKNRHLCTIAQICRAISSQLRHLSTIGKNNIVNFGPVAAEIASGVWGIPMNFNGFIVLAALLHGAPIVGVSQTLRRWTEGATYIRQGDHYIGLRPTF